MKLEEIHWPVFLLRGEDPITHNGVCMYGRLVYDIELEIYRHQFRIIDDKSIPGGTLGERRLHLSTRKVPLYRLNKAVYSVGDLLRLTSNTKPWVIDSSGILFKYKRKIRAPLTCHKITKVLRNSKGTYILELEGIPERFKLLNDVQDCKYAGVLTINRKYILYGLYEESFKKTFRKV